MTEYVVGFAFSPACTRVALVRKARPAWQRGFLNGIGGKLEPGESPLDAMVREFREETGLATAPTDWAPRVRLTFPGGAVTFFSACLSDLGAVRTTTDEPIEVVDSLPVHPDALPNLHWLIPFCLDALAGPVEIQDANGGSDLRAVLEALREGASAQA